MSDFNSRNMQKIIIYEYGLVNQLKKMQEEIKELDIAIIDYNNNNNNENFLHLIEELADVKNLIEQLEINSFEIKNGIERNILFKCQREINRINTRRKTDV